MSLSVCPGVGNSPLRKKKWQIPGGVLGGGHGYKYSEALAPP